MIGLISFGLKIIFASIIGGALNYIPGKSKRNHNIVETSLICIFSSSILGLTRQFTDNGEYFVMGFGVLSVIIFIVALTKNFEFTKRIIWMFAAVLGMIIGSGFFIQACLLCLLVYFILHNSENLMTYINKKPENAGDAGI